MQFHKIFFCAAKLTKILQIVISIHYTAFLPSHLGVLLITCIQSVGLGPRWLGGRASSPLMLINTLQAVIFIFSHNYYLTGKTQAFENSQG